MSTPEERINAFLIQWRAVWKTKTDIHYAHGIGNEAVGLSALDLVAVLDELKAARAECAELRRTIRNLHESREEAHECNGRHWVEVDENAVVDL